VSQKPWTKAEHQQLRAIYSTLPTKEVAQAMRRSAKAIASRAKLLGLRKDVGCGGHRPWTKAQEQLLREIYPNRPTAEVAQRAGHTVSATYRWAKKLGLHKSREYLDSPAACRLRRGDNIGAACRFQKGHIPANKGLRRPGWSPGRMRETQFKKGHTSSNYLPIGTVRSDSDGYLRRKIADGAGGFGNAKVWELVHRRVWKDAYGPIPKGHRIWWKDRNHANCALENLELLSDAEHMARTTVHNLPPELRQVVQLAGVLKRRINAREKHDHRSA
jgi:hypothetical protein